MALEDIQNPELGGQAHRANISGSEEPSQQLHDANEKVNKKLRDAAAFFAWGRQRYPHLNDDQLLQLAAQRNIELTGNLSQIPGAGPSNSPVDPGYQREVSGLQSAFDEQLREEGLEPDRVLYRDYSTTEYGQDQGDFQVRSGDDRTYEPKKRDEAEKAAADAVYGEKVRRGRSAGFRELSKDERAARSKVTINGEPRYLSHGMDTYVPTDEKSDRDPVREEFISRKGVPVEYDVDPLRRETIINALLEAGREGPATTPENLEEFGTQPVRKRKLVREDRTTGKLYYPSSRNEGEFKPEMDPGHASRDVLAKLDAFIASGQLTPEQLQQAKDVRQRLSVSADPRAARDADREAARTTIKNNPRARASAQTEADNALEAFLLGKRRLHRDVAAAEDASLVQLLRSARGLPPEQGVGGTGDVNLDRVFISRTGVDPTQMPVAGYAYPGAPAQDKLTLQALGADLEADPLILQRLGHALQTGSALANAPTTGQALNAPNNNPPQTLLDLAEANFDPTRQVTNISGELGLLAERAAKGLKTRDGRVYTPLPSSGIRSYGEAEAVLNNLLSAGRTAGVNFGSKDDPVTDPGINHLLRNNLHYSSPETQRLMNALIQIKAAETSGINQSFKDSYQGGGIASPYRSEEIMASLDLGASGPNVRFGVEELPTERPGVQGVLKQLQTGTDSEKARFKRVDASRIEGTAQEQADAAYDAALPYKGQLIGDRSRNAKSTVPSEKRVRALLPRNPSEQQLRYALDAGTKKGKNQTPEQYEAFKQNQIDNAVGIRSRQAATDAANPPSPVINDRGRIILRDGADPTPTTPAMMGIPEGDFDSSAIEARRNEAELDRLAGSHPRNDSATTRRRREEALLKRSQRTDSFGGPTGSPAQEPPRGQNLIAGAPEPKSLPYGIQTTGAEQGPKPGSGIKQLLDRANYIRQSPRAQRGRRIGYGIAGAGTAAAGLSALLQDERDRRTQETY